MRYSMTTSALVAGTLAIVIPFDFQPCAPLRNSVAPEPNPNTAESFGSFKSYSVIANLEQTPSGYERIVADGNAAVQSGDKYMHHVDLHLYDAFACAKLCDEAMDCQACK
jgi:hypothetical protein